MIFILLFKVFVICDCLWLFVPLHIVVWTAGQRFAVGERVDKSDTQRHDDLRLDNCDHVLRRHPIRHSWLVREERVPESVGRLAALLLHTHAQFWKSTFIGRIFCRNKQFSNEYLKDMSFKKNSKKKMAKCKFSFILLFQFWMFLELFCFKSQRQIYWAGAWHAGGHFDQGHEPQI